MKVLVLVITERYLMTLSVVKITVCQE